MAVISAPYSSAASSRGIFGLDWPLLFLVVLLAIWGCLTVTSATLPSLQSTPTSTVPLRGSTTQKPPESGKGKISDATKQAAWIVVGLAALIALSVLNFQWLMHLQGWLYGLNLLALIAVLFVGREINGAKSWIVLGPISLQLSEFSKVAVLVSLAAFLTRRQERVGEMKTLLLSLLYLVPPLLLIMKQPDFGTMLATLSIWFGMAFFGGARLRHLGLIALVGILAFTAAWKGGILKPHQKERLAVFLNPDASPREGGYQLKQSQIAIGSGQITGQGWGQGMQNRARYVPENSTDFIFTVVAEELGFAGGAALLLLYLLLLLRTASIATTTENYFGVLLCGGFTALLAFHCIINLGMTMRVMPITGVPLPFFSYGGSSFLAFSMGAGLMQSVAVHRRR